MDEEQLEGEGHCYGLEGKSAKVSWLQPWSHLYAFRISRL